MAKSSDDLKAVDRLISLGRECVREILRDGEAKAVIVIIGRVPKQGFPRGQILGENTDGKPIRMYSAAKFLTSVQQYLKRIEQAMKPVADEGGGRG